MRSAGLLFIVVAMLLTAGAGRLAYIQYTDGEALQQRAQRQQTTKISIPALRGDILDTKGRLLAGSARRPSVFADPYVLKDPRDIRYAAHSVAPVLGLNTSQLETLLHECSSRRFVWIKRQISDQELEAFNTLRHARQLRAFGVQYESVRTYPQGRLAAHVLGFVGDPSAGVFRGLSGIELSCDDWLTGIAGQRISTVDAYRRRLRTDAADYVAPQDGATIVLTIDSYVQERVELHLRTAMDEHQAEWGTAVVMAPQSGDILAMASWPDFDPSRPIPPEMNAEEARIRLRNRAISDAFEPGSIFKPFIASYALDEQMTRLDEVFVINGPARSFGHHTVHDTHTYDSLQLHEVISRSSNIGMALLGLKCGNKRLYRYVRQFGFGAPTGILLPGEHGGLVNSYQHWNDYSTRCIPFGQEIAVTALQIVTAFSALSNGGVLYRPRIMRGVIGPDGEIIRDDSQPALIRRILNPETAAQFLEQALVEVVMSEIGTGKNARVENYRVFGKTGTAQVASIEGGGYLPDAYTGSFIGGAPADHPQVVVLVSLYKPSAGKYYGGTVAAPAVSAILADTLAYMQVPPEMTCAQPSGE